MSFQAMQWKQTLSSASNKSQPVVAGWAADQARSQVQDLGREKKTVFIVVNQGLRFLWVAHKTESGNG